MEACHFVQSMAQGTVDALASNQLVVNQAIDAIGTGRHLCSCSSRVGLVSSSTRY
ncbi:hypothetical protein BDW68DRAFT_161901 [Aspergillus falconensis]